VIPQGRITENAVADLQIGRAIEIHEFYVWGQLQNITLKDSNWKEEIGISRNITKLTRDHLKNRL